MGNCYCNDLTKWRKDAKILNTVISKSQKGLEDFQKADDAKKNIESFFLKSKESDAYFINDNARLHANVVNFKKNLKTDFEAAISDIELNLSNLNTKIEDFQELDDKFHEEQDNND